MSAVRQVKGMKAIVLYSTRFGTTERVARSFESGLRDAGIATACANTQDVAPEALNQYDLICVGAPTEMFSASKPMKEFLDSIKDVDLSGKLGYAFDTKLDSRVSGSAAKYIEHALDDKGMRLVARRESAIVTNTKYSGKITGAILREGEEQRFAQLGLLVGNAAAEESAKLASR